MRKFEFISRQGWVGFIQAETLFEAVDEYLRQVCVLPHDIVQIKEVAPPLLERRCPENVQGNALQGGGGA